MSAASNPTPPLAAPKHGQAREALHQIDGVPAWRCPCGHLIPVHEGCGHCGHRLAASPSGGREADYLCVLDKLGNPITTREVEAGLEADTKWLTDRFNAEQFPAHAPFSIIPLFRPPVAPPVSREGEVGEEVAQVIKTLEEERDRLKEAIAYFKSGSITEPAQERVAHYEYAIRALSHPNTTVSRPVAWAFVDSDGEAGQLWYNYDLDDAKAMAEHTCQKLVPLYAAPVREVTDNETWCAIREAVRGVLALRQSRVDESKRLVLASEITDSAIAALATRDGGKADV